MQKVCEYSGVRNSVESGNFRENFVEFRVEKAPFLFLTHYYIWAFSG